MPDLIFVLAASIQFKMRHYFPNGVLESLGAPAPLANNLKAFKKFISMNIFLNIYGP